MSTTSDSTQMVELCVHPEIWILLAASIKRNHPGLEFFEVPSGEPSIQAFGIRPVGWPEPTQNALVVAPPDQN